MEGGVFTSFLFWSMDIKYGLWRISEESEYSYASLLD